MKNIYIPYIFGIVLLIFLIYSIIGHNTRDKALEDHVLVIAKIKELEITRGVTNVYVEYKYEGKTINNLFGTYNTDSLSVNKKVRLIISKEYPDKYIKYVGLAK